MIDAIVGHLVGDYLLQNDWMALNKKANATIAAILFLLEGGDTGVYHASMMQSDPPDTIAVTGRAFRTRGDVRLLLAALGG